MPRPDLTAERTEQLLDAFARCISREGVEGTSLQDVADEAGVHKSIIRHYIGSRADLVTALSRRTIDSWQREYEQSLADAAPGRRFALVMDALFSSEADPHEEPLFDALTRHPQAYPEATGLWLAALEGAIAWLRHELRIEYPASRPADRRLVASGVWALALSADEEIPVKALSGRTLRGAAERLISTLEPRS